MNCEFYRMLTRVYSGSAYFYYSSVFFYYTQHRKELDQSILSIKRGTQLGRSHLDLIGKRPTSICANWSSVFICGAWNGVLKNVNVICISFLLTERKTFSIIKIDKIVDIWVILWYLFITLNFMWYCHYYSDSWFLSRTFIYLKKWTNTSQSYSGWRCFASI